MDFSKGQIIFALAFILVFGVAVAYTYLKDKKRDKNYYRGAYKVLLAIILLFTIFYLIVKIAS